MRARDAFLALLLAGCAHSGAPKDWLPEPDEAMQETHGGWVLVRLTDATVHRGELIAVDADSLVLLEDSTFVAVANAQVKDAYVTGYESGAGTLAAWTAMGVLSTASHGWYLAFSLPTWVLMGSVLASSESHAPRVRVSAASWDKARLYARFPQGMPEGLDRTALVPGSPRDEPVKPHSRHWGR